MTKAKKQENTHIGQHIFVYNSKDRLYYSAKVIAHNEGSIRVSYSDQSISTAKNGINEGGWSDIRLAKIKYKNPTSKDAKDERTEFIVLDGNEVITYTLQADGSMKTQSISSNKKARLTTPTTSLEHKNEIEALDALIEIKAYSSKEEIEMSLNSAGAAINNGQLKETMHTNHSNIDQQIADMKAKLAILETQKKLAEEYSDYNVSLAKQRMLLNELISSTSKFLKNTQEFATQNNSTVNDILKSLDSLTPELAKAKHENEQNIKQLLTLNKQLEANLITVLHPTNAVKITSSSFKI